MARRAVDGGDDVQLVVTADVVGDLPGQVEVEEEVLAKRLLGRGERGRAFRARTAASDRRAGRPRERHVAQAGLFVEFTAGALDFGLARVDALLSFGEVRP